VTNLPFAISQRDSILGLSKEEAAFVGTAVLRQVQLEEMG
jgi:hypothetical protein